MLNKLSFACVAGDRKKGLQYQSMLIIQVHSTLEVIGGSINHRAKTQGSKYDAVRPLVLEVPSPPSCELRLSHIGFVNDCMIMFDKR
jgi:hypothetical protein